MTNAMIVEDMFQINLIVAFMNFPIFATIAPNVAMNVQWVLNLEKISFQIVQNVKKIRNSYRYKREKICFIPHSQFLLKIVEFYRRECSFFFSQTFS